MMLCQPRPRPVGPVDYSGVVQGRWTRVAAVPTWFGAYCFQNRNWYVLNGGDDLLLIAPWRSISRWDQC